MKYIPIWVFKAYYAAFLMFLYAASKSEVVKVGIFHQGRKVLPILSHVSSNDNSFHRQITIINCVRATIR